MPSRWTVRFDHVDPGKVKLEYLHAVVRGWLDSDPQQHKASSKGFSITPLWRKNSHYYIDILLIDDNLVPPLLEHATSGSTIRLGNHSVTVRHAPQCVSLTTWEGLLKPSTANAWSLHFVTPLTFRKGNIFSPFPSPYTIIGSLEKTWQNFAPQEFRHQVLSFKPEPVWVSDIDGKNHAMKFSNLSISGFVGMLKLVANCDEQTNQHLCRLFHLANYTGIGSYTTKGFGITDIEFHRPPRITSQTPTTSG